MYNIYVYVYIVHMCTIHIVYMCIKLCIYNIYITYIYYKSLHISYLFILIYFFYLFLHDINKYQSMEK